MFKKFLLVGFLSAFAVGVATAQDSETTYKGPEDKSRIKIPGIDKNGDGCLDMTEIDPNGQLAKRFSTRDVNHDGKLCKDEYFTP
jgi:hypothetical protein